MKILLIALALFGCSDDTQPSQDASAPDAPVDASAAMDAPFPDADPALMEPYLYLPRIFEGAKAYWEQLPSGPPKQFSADAPMTPAVGTCCGSLDGLCVPNSSLWLPAWAPMNFSIDVPVHYSFDFVSAGSEATATFVARAVGDLDCDNVYSTYEIHGSIDSAGVVVASPITATRPTE